MPDMKKILNGPAAAIARRALPSRARNAARQAAERLGMTSEPAPGKPCQVLFVNGYDEADAAEGAARIAHLRQLLSQRGASTDEVAADDFTLDDEARSKALVLCRCQASRALHDAIVRAHGSGKKTFYDWGEKADACEGEALARPADAFEQLARDNAALRRSDAEELCDAVLTSDIDDDAFVATVNPAPLSIEDAFQDEDAEKAAVESFLRARGFELPKTAFDPRPWQEVPLEGRLQRLRNAHRRGVNAAILLYERACGDDATFRYYGFNVSERLADSARWDGVYFFVDELDRLSSELASADLVVLIRMRYRPEIARFANAAHEARIPVACFIDDNVVGAQKAPRVIRAMAIDSSSEFEKDFWRGVTSRFQLTADLCDCFIASTGALAETLQSDQGKPAFVIGPSLNDAQVGIAQEIVAADAPAADESFTIGYFCGTSSHNDDFALIEKPLLAFMHQHEDARLLFGGSLRLDESLQALWRDGRVELVPFVDYATLSYLQAAADVVLAPLALDDFTKCKSNLKVFEAGVVGTPSIASPSPSYVEAIENGVTGFTCETDDEWTSALEKLHAEGAAALAGKAARQRALELYYGSAVAAMAETAFDAAASVQLVDGNGTERPAVAVKNWDDPFEANVAFGKAGRNDPSSIAATQTSRAAELVRGGMAKAQREGLQVTVSTTASFAKEQIGNKRFAHKNPEPPTFFDILFVNGCAYSLPHPIRYRVDHQVQQLESNGLKVKRIDAWDLTTEDIGSARAFVFFRCPYTSELGEFVALAKKLNKLVYFDIDDLVIDRKYTDTIKFLATMSDMDRAGYDDGVDSMGRMLRTCGRAITTTERLAEELSTIVPEVFVNRNTASEEMILYSNRAVRERDELPFMDEKQVDPSERAHRRWAIRQRRNRVEGSVSIGYFSGSITHNADVDLVLPALVDVMSQRPNVRFCVAGILDLPPELEPFRDRIDTFGFGPWKRLPDLIASVDINIAPLEDSIFNEAKSENKWVEAALVKVPTVASDLGAFAKMIDDGVTGVLCRTLDDWRDALLDLVDDPAKRRRIGEAARERCMRDCTTIAAGHKLATYLRQQFNPNVFMVLPGINISGGVLVALKHCALLQRAGYDVTIVDAAVEEERYREPLYAFDGCLFPVIRGKSEQNVHAPNLLLGSIDQMVATMWTTTLLFDECPNIARRQYLVQNFETDFYEAPDYSRVRANATYTRTDTEYLTISKWCKDWLEGHFQQKVRFAPNGIANAAYPIVQRDFGPSRKTRILVEGDAESYYKNVDEAFDITNQLDPERYEVWYMSYNAGPKARYRVDKFLHKVPHEKVGEVYAACDILLKTSILESFSYPPLEMMATGGLVVAIPNDGNREYLQHGYNCLLFESGDAKTALADIQLIEQDAELRDKLVRGGLETAQSRDWSAIEPDVLALYE